MCINGTIDVLMNIVNKAKAFEDKYHKQLNILFYVLFAFIYIHHFYDTTWFSFPGVDSMIRLLSYGSAILLIPLCILSILTTENKGLMVCKILVVGIALFQQVYLSRYKMSVLELLAVASDRKSMKAILRVYLYIGIVFMITAFIGSATGYLPDFVDGHRHNFGIVYSLDCAAHYLYLLIAAHMLFFKKHKWLMLGVTAVVTIFVWTLIEAKTSMVLFLIFVIFDLIIVVFPKAKKILLYNKPAEIFLIGSFIIFFIVILVMTIRYEESWGAIAFFRKWRTLTWRLQLGQAALQEYPIKFFGQQVYESLQHGGEIAYFFIDCSYLRCLIMYGITHFIFLMSALTYIQYRFIKHKFHIFAFMFMLIAIHSTMEILLLDVAYNFILVLLFARFDIPKIED